MDLPIKMVIFHSYVSLPEGIQSQLASLAVLFVVDYMLMIVDAHSAPILQGCWRLILNFPIPLLKKKNVYMIKTHFGDHFTHILGTILLVGGLEHILFSIIYGIILPID